MEKSKKEKRVHAPLLKAYLREQRMNPPHLPIWTDSAPWVAAISVALLFGKFSSVGGFALMIGAAVWFFTRAMIKERFRAKDGIQKVDEVHYAAIAKLKWMLEDGFDRRIPPRVMTALEEAVMTHNTVVARLSVSTDPTAVERIEEVKRLLHGCLVASTLVVRGHECSAKDWKAILQNKTLIHEVVLAIEEQKFRMQEPTTLDPERLAALQELEEGLNPEIRVQS